MPWTGLIYYNMFVSCCKLTSFLYCILMAMGWNYLAVFTYVESITHYNHCIKHICEEPLALLTDCVDLLGYFGLSSCLSAAIK